VLFLTNIVSGILNDISQMTSPISAKKFLNSYLKNLEYRNLIAEFGMVKILGVCKNSQQEID